MHSNVRFMLRKNDATMPFSRGGFRVYADLCLASCVRQSRIFFYLNLLLINLFINQINSL